MKNIDGVLTFGELASRHINLVALAPGGVDVGLWQRRRVDLAALAPSGTGVGHWLC
jgi:hypothetical protein